VLRYELQQWLLAHSHSQEKAILVALLVGDTSLISKDQWAHFTKTGTNHLIAISGLHLGFFAILGFFIGELIGRFVQLIWYRCPASVLGHLLAMALTLFYSLVAGMNIPTLRTLIMLGIVHMVCLARRSFRISNVFCFALVCVLIYDPLAAFDMGFWLSFGAVGILLFCFAARLHPLGHRERWGVRALREFLKSQWLMFIGLLIPLIILVNTFSLLAPAANLLAIPLITFFVVPCLIIAAVFQQAFGQNDSIFLAAAEKGTELFYHWLQYLVQADIKQLNPSVAINPQALPLAIAGVCLLLLPKGLRKPYLGVCALALSLAVPLEQVHPLQLLTFDVGQGTAVLIRTPHHQLLYDTGPAFTENFDAGSGIVTPYLHSKGLVSLDALIVSHNDADHSGGMDAILANFEVKDLWLGEPEKHRLSVDRSPAQDCHGVADWQWDEVRFHFLEWQPLSMPKSNNRSCVLLVEYQGRRILITGDIEKPVEKQLLAQKALTPVDILFAPHHGSHSSSTPGFVAETYPKYVIYSAGYRNQHGHPHKDVRERYQRVDAKGLNTAFSGAIEFNFNDGKFELTEYRRSQRRYSTKIDVWHGFLQRMW
jgi:competence protein ComEC